jgi:hypothetical protein
VKLNNITQIVVALGLTATMGCETVHMHNTVYQYDAPDTVGESNPSHLMLDTGLTSLLEANYCFTDHYGGLTPYQNRPNSCEFYEGEGFCCKWTSDSSDSYLCEEEWCYWEDTCDWDLNGWGEVCTLKNKEDAK